MSKAILTAIRSQTQLKGSLKFTALELAHLASCSGYARVSYSTLARKTGQSIKTMIRHVQRLISMGLLVKQRIRLTLTRFAVNQYRFLVGPETLHKCSTPSLGGALPEEGKIFARAGEKPTLTEAAKRWLATLRRQYPLEVAFHDS
jgi:hypothetical protein